jgi:hypothetical protein
MFLLFIEIEMQKSKKKVFLCLGALFGGRG